jgi:peptidyl-prolyl cis-trans isomerase SurA
MYLSLEKLKKYFYFNSLIVGAFFSIIFKSEMIDAEIVDRVIASIDGDPVTEEEIREIIASQVLLSSDDSTTMAQELDPLIIKEGIISLLFEKEARRMNIVVSNEDINAYVNQVEQANKADKGSLIDALKEKGISFEAYRKKIRSEMLRSKILSAELRPKIQVTDEEIDEYIGAPVSPEEVDENKNTFSLVRVTFTDTSYQKNENARSVLEEMRSIIKEQKKCTGISSMGGFCEDFGEVEINELKKDLQVLLDKKSFYDPSQIIEDENGLAFYLKGQKNFVKRKSQVKEEIRQKLFQERFMEAAETYLKKDLFDRYHVEIHDL